MGSVKQSVAIYLRVSTADQSTAMQRAELEQYANARGWNVVSVYEDQASGTSTERRPMWRQAMKDARGRKFSILLVWRLDRWARSLKDLILSLQELTDIGVQFVSLRDQIDMTTPSGRLMLHIIAAFADFEAQVIKERVRAGVAAAKARGQKLGRPPKLDKFVILTMRQQGLSLGQIAKHLGTSRSAVAKSLKRLLSTNLLTKSETIDESKTVSSED